MAVQRYLGAAWASAHGPTDPTRLLRWLLEARFRGLVPGPALRAIDWSALAASAHDLPISFPAVRASSILSEKSSTAGIASSRDADQKLAALAVDEAVLLAHQVGARVVIVEPGVVPLLGEVGPEDLGDASITWTETRAQALVARAKAGRAAALDAACRALFSYCKAHPEFTFCLTPGRSLRALASPETLAAIFEDLGNKRVAYWHDTAMVGRREQVLGEPQGRWLDDFSNRCVGCTLGDARPDGVYLPPGAGGVDYPLLTSYLRRAHKAVPVVLELDPAVAGGELPGVRACLEKFGL